MKKNILFMIAAMSIVAAILFYLRPDGLQSASSDNFSHDVTQKNSDFVTDKPAASDDLAATAKHDKVAIMQAIEPNAVKQLIIPTYFKDPSSGFLFRFDHEEMSRKQEGDEFAVKMLQFDINRQAQIKHVEVLEDDITRWEGGFEGYPEDINHFTLTQSLKDRYSILKVFTDKGTYIAEIKDGIGLAKPEIQLTDDELHVDH